MKIGSSKLIKLIRGLSSTELNGFVEYVRSPIHNSHEKVTGLAELLLKANGRYDIEGRIIYKKLFGDEKYSQHKLGHVMSYTLKLLEEYLAFLFYRSNPFYSGLFLLGQLNNKNLDDFVPGVHKRIDKLLENNTLRDNMYYKNRHETQAVFSTILMEGEITSGPKDSEKKSESIQEKADALDLYYLYTKLEYYCEMALRKRTATGEFRFDLADEILSYVKKNLHAYEKHPGIKIYYYIFLTLTDTNNKKHVHSLLSLLDTHRDNFSQDELRSMYFYVSQFYSHKITEGDTDYIKKLFVLLKKLLENKSLRFKDNYINQWDYLRMVTVGIRANEYDWTRKFIESYKKHLHPSYRKNVYAYNLALYYSYTDPKEAQKLLKDVQFESVFYHLGARSILLRIYYETNNDELFFYHTNTYAAFLKRNKAISTHHRKIHANLLKFTRKSFDIKQGGNKKSKEKLFRQIEQTQHIANRKWLMEKVNEL